MSRLDHEKATRASKGADAARLERQGAREARKGRKRRHHDGEPASENQRMFLAALLGELGRPVNLAPASTRGQVSRLIKNARVDVTRHRVAVGACPSCGALPGQPCKGRRGTRKLYHASRSE